MDYYLLLSIVANCRRVSRCGAKQSRSMRHIPGIRYVCDWVRNNGEWSGPPEKKTWCDDNNLQWHDWQCHEWTKSTMVGCGKIEWKSIERGKLRKLMVEIERAACSTWWKRKWNKQKKQQQKKNSIVYCDTWARANSCREIEEGERARRAKVHAIVFTVSAFGARHTTQYGVERKWRYTIINEVFFNRKMQCCCWSMLLIVGYLSWPLARLVPF